MGISSGGISGTQKIEESLRTFQKDLEKDEKVDAILDILNKILIQLEILTGQNI